jgi:hypothetical protein
LLKQKVDGPLQARIKKSFLPNTDEGNDSSQLLAKVDPPMAWNSVDPSSQIGLLQPFYNTLQMVPDAMIEVFDFDIG